MRIRFPPPCIINFQIVDLIPFLSLYSIHSQIFVISNFHLITSIPVSFTSQLSKDFFFRFGNMVNLWWFTRIFDKHTRAMC